jgi:nucleoside-diphosphate-sugar epimerase
VDTRPHLTVSRVLVTGATGFIGREAVRELLRSGCEVHAAVRPGTRGPDGTIAHPWDPGDERSSERVCAASRPTHLLHLAWCTGLLDHKTSARNLDWTAASIGLLAAFARSGGRRFVGAGTYAEYGTFEGTCGEDEPARPATLYAAAKWSFGSLALAYGSDAGLQVTWARPFLVFGAGEPPVRLIPQIAAALVAGRTFETTDGLQVRDFIHVRDVASGLALLLRSEHHGVANIGSGVGRPVRDVIEAVAARTGGRELVQFGKRTRPSSEPTAQIAEPATLRALGWAPQVAFDDGLSDEVARLAAPARTS